MQFRLLTALILLSPLAARELPVRLFTTNDGLLNNRVHRIVTDSRGLLWICTGSGISRFDGAQFQNFGLAQGLPFAAVNDLLETPDGNFWLATNGGGIIRFALAASAPRFEAFPVSQDPTSNRVNSLYRAPDGVIWLGTDGGAFRMTVDARGQPVFSRVALRLPGHPEAMVQVWSIRTDAEGSFWMGTRFGLLRLLDGGRIIWYPIRKGPETDTVLTLLYTPEDGRLWIGHQGGLVIFLPPPASSYGAEQGRDQPFEDLTIQRSQAGRGLEILDEHPVLPRQPGESSYFDTSRYSSPPQVGDIQRSRSGAVRVLVSQAYFEFSSGRFNLLRDPRLQESDLGTSAQDREGNVWISTRSGALRLARRGFVTFREQDGIGRTVGSVLEDRSGQVIVFSQDWRISRFDGQAFHTVRLNVPAAATKIGWRNDQDMIQDHTGDWWFATRAGLMRFSGVTRLEDLAGKIPRFYTSRDGLAQDSVLRLFEDSRGDVWIASLIPGRTVLTRWERASGVFHRYSDADGLPAFNAPTSFYEDPRGALWIAFRDGGMARYRDGRFSMFTEADGLPPGNISNLMPDHSGRLWFTHNRLGLFRVDDLEGTPLKPVQVAGPRELRGSLVNRILEDRDGNILAVTSVGIFRIDSAAGGRVAALYTTNEGLADTDVNSVFADRRGGLWFGTAHGLSLFQPGASERAAPPPVRIGGVRAGGRDQALSPAGELSVSGLELRPGGSQLEIDFFGLSFALGDPLEFEYRLLGAADDQWSRPGPQRSVLFSSLAPGGYEFQVRAISAAGERSPQPASVIFRVLPPVWRRWWFLTLVAVALAAALAAFERYRARARRVLAESEVRFRTLAETASDAIVTIDDSGNLTYVNPAVETIFGYRPEELIGRELTVLMPENMREHHRQGLARYRATGERRLSWKAIELPGLRKDGREIPMEVAFGEFRRDGRHYFTGTIRDISERKQAEEKLLKAREERYAELERVRQRIAADLHDEIGSSLTQISILSEVAHRRGAEADPGLSHPLSAIASSSRELVDAMSDIVWAINPAKDHLSDLTQRMRRLASDTFTACNTAFHLELPHGAEDLKLGANLRREIFLIFKEGVNNMVKHSGCTEAMIRLTMHSAMLRLELTDNGKGFDPAIPSEGHGLTSLRSRAAALGGVLAIVTAPGAGTAITLDIPIPT